MELKRRAAIQNENDKNYVHRFVDFYGKGQGETFALEMMQTNNLAHLPLFLNEEVNIMDEKEETIIFTYNEKFTLSEFIYGLVYELTTFGHPDERDFQKSLIFDRFDKMEENELSGKSLEDFETDLKGKVQERINKGKIPCVVCGNDSRSQHFNKPKDMCFSCFSKSKEN